MKPEKHQKNTPEESLRNACEEGMGLDLHYSEIRDRLDTTEISRVGKVRKAAKPAMIPTDAPAPAPRRAVPAILLVLAVLIGLHNIPEGMAVSVPLISGGMSKWKAVLITAASGIPTILGALLGYLLGEIGPMGLTMSLGFASGAMLYVVFGEILPQSILMYHSKLPAFSAIAGILVGMLIIF